MEDSPQKIDNSLKQTHSESKKRPHLILLVVFMVVIAGAIAYVGLNLNEKRQTDEQKSTELGEAKTAMIEIGPTGFQPSTLKVSPGTTVIWTNIDQSPHRVAADPHPSHESLSDLDGLEALENGDSYTYTFDKQGRVTYHDHLNPENKGVIIVE
jgi:plastocyanin